MANTSKWMMDSTEAHNYIVNPLIAPDPSDETGLNSSFRSTFAAPTESQESLIRQQKLFQQQQKTQQQKPSTLAAQSSPLAARPRASSNASPPTNPFLNPSVPIRRGQSLNHGAKNKHEKHRRRVSLHPVDTIDSLDSVPGGPYHHEGPYDSTLISRNLNSQTSPVAAVAESNAAALRATPRENVLDAVLRHRPLDGTATVPPGLKDEFGRKYSYEERNLMTDGGYGKWMWVGEDLDEVQKADMNQEPAWNIRNDYPSSAADSSSSINGVVTTHPPEDVELDEMSKPKKAVDVQEQEVQADGSGISRSHSLREGLKRRIGSLRRKKD